MSIQGNAFAPTLPELEFVRYTVKDRIAYITLNRPEKRNAMSDQVMEELRLAFQHFDLDPQAFVGILHGAGSCFTSGADVRQRQLRPREELEAFGIWSPKTRRRDLFYDFVNWKPLISAVHGYAMGAGVGMAMNCDIVVATESTKFQITEVSRGVHGSTLWALLHFRGGGSFADEVALTGRMFTGAEAARYNLITKATPDDSYMAEAEAYARVLLSHPPLAVRAGVRVRRKYAMQSQQLSWTLTETVPALHLTDDFREAARAFVEKREPAPFQGR